MLTLLFTVLFFMVFGKLFMLSMRATWGITKILFSLVFLPIAFILLVLGGLVSLALPALAVVGVVALIAGARD